MEYLLESDHLVRCSNCWSSVCSRNVRVEFESEGDGRCQTIAVNLFTSQRSLEAVCPMAENFIFSLASNFVQISPHFLACADQTSADEIRNICTAVTTVQPHVKQRLQGKREDKTVLPSYWVDGAKLPTKNLCSAFWRIKVCTPSFIPAVINLTDEISPSHPARRLAWYLSAAFKILPYCSHHLMPHCPSWEVNNIYR